MELILVVLVAAILAFLYVGWARKPGGELTAGQSILLAFALLVLFAFLVVFGFLLYIGYRMSTHTGGL